MNETNIIPPVIYEYSSITGEILRKTTAELSPRPYKEGRIVWAYPQYWTDKVPPTYDENQTALFDKDNDCWNIVYDYRGEIWYLPNGEEVEISGFGMPDKSLTREMPNIEETAKSLNDISARQFWQAALSMGITEDGIVKRLSDKESSGYIADEEERESMIIDIRKPQGFSRKHPMVEMLSKVVGLTESQLDDLWRWAETIK